MFLDISVEAVCTGGQSSFHEAGSWKLEDTGQGTTGPECTGSGLS